MDSDLYRDITDFAHDTPSWMQHFVELWTEVGLVLFGVLFVACWWRARRADPTAMALALLAPLATAVAYISSEVIKTLVVEERPCRAVKGAATSLITCPVNGDWSFPSNHATIAGGAAVALALAWPRIWALTVPMALAMAFSRVYVGVHYPHDVAVGLLLGTAVAVVFAKAGTRPVRSLVESMRASGNGAALWLSGPGAPLHARR
ncbi:MULTISPECIES: phosphatase PAP2 family protein [unclassified Streptomyces]|uniref:phosphatase PAP2 family protein n=1 Tax=unclassified Streptomyces TaxID=2593676 RepID=UPI0033E25F96